MKTLVFALMLLLNVQTVQACNYTLMTYPQDTVIGLCEMLGALPGSRACAAPGDPGFILMPTFETARTEYGGSMSRSEYTYTYQHEFAHACLGLPAEH